MIDTSWNHRFFSHNKNLVDHDGLILGAAAAIVGSFNDNKIDCLGPVVRVNIRQGFGGVSDMD